MTTFIFLRLRRLLKKLIRSTALPPRRAPAEMLRAGKPDESHAVFPWSTYLR